MVSVPATIDTARSGMTASAIASLMKRGFRSNATGTARRTLSSSPGFLNEKAAR